MPSTQYRFGKTPNTASGLVHRDEEKPALEVEGDANSMTPTTLPDSYIAGAVQAQTGEGNISKFYMDNRYSHS